MKSPSQSVEPKKRRAFRTKILVRVGAALLFLGIAFAFAHRPLVAAGFLLRVQGEEGAFARYGEHPVEQQTVDSGAMRYYFPAGEDPRALPPVLLLHGIHEGGLDEPRLTAFATQLASLGLLVGTPRLNGLAEYRVDEDSLLEIHSAADALRAYSDTEVVSGVGISFGGGLLLVAAAQQPGRFACVLTVGGHHNLGRVSRFFLGDGAVGPSGEPFSASPHPYAIGVLTYSRVDSLFSPPDREAAREALLHVLRGDHDQAQFAAQGVSLEGSRLIAEAAAGEGPELARRLRELLDRETAALASVSPAGHLEGIGAEVFALHGAADSIVPPTETLWLADELPAATTLVTGVLGHAEVEDGVSLWDQWEVVQFMSSVLECVEQSR